MTTVEIIAIILQILGGASIILRAIAPLTKTKTDDKIVRFIDEFLKIVSLDSNSKGLKKLEIKKGDDKIEIPLKNK